MNQPQKNYLKNRVKELAGDKIVKAGGYDPYSKQYRSGDRPEEAQLKKAHKDAVIKKLLKMKFLPEATIRKNTEGRDCCTVSNIGYIDCRYLIDTSVFKPMTKKLENDLEEIKNKVTAVVDTIRADAESLIDEIMIGDSDRAMELLKQFQSKEY